MSQNLSSAAVVIGALRVKGTLINRQNKGLKDMSQLTAGQKYFCNTFDLHKAIFGLEKHF